MSDQVKVRKQIFNEASALLTKVLNENVCFDDKDSEMYFKSEMIRYISYLIKKTPNMTTLTGRNDGKGDIHKWLRSFNSQQYDMACSALMTTAVDLFI